jgi:hypothetical protein
MDTQEIYDKAQEFMSDNDTPDEIQTLFMTPLCDLCDEVERLRGALEYYADPATYFGIGFFPDPPCGDFINDGSETDLGMKPGAKAREALKESE